MERLVRQVYKDVPILQGGVEFFLSWILKLPADGVKVLV